MHANLRNLAKSSSIYGIGGILTKFVSVLLLPVFTSFLTPTDYGVLSMLAMTGMVLIPVFSLGLGTSIGVCYFNSKCEDEKKSILWNAFLVLCFSAGTLTLIAWCFSDTISILLFQNDDYSNFVTLSLMATSLSLIVLPCQLKLQFEENAKIYVLISFSSVLVTSVLSLMLVVYFDRAVTGYLEASVIGQAITLALFLLATWRENIFSISAKVIRELLNNGFPMIPSFFFLFIMQNGARFPLEWYHGLEVVGIYTIGANFGLMLGVFTGAFINAWTPFALSFAHKQTEAADLLGRVTYYYLFIFGFLTLLFFIFSKPLVMLFTTQAFHDAYQVVGLAAATQYLNALFMMLLPPIYFAKDVRIVSVVQCIAAITSMVLFVVFIPNYGAIGAAVAVLLASIMQLVLQYSWLRREKYLKINYDVMSTIKIMVVLSLLALSTFAFSSKDLVTEFVIALVYSIVAGAVFFLMSGLNIKTAKNALSSVLIQR